MELVLGMLVTTMVMGALAALLGAVAQGWEQSGQAQSTSNVVVQTHVRVQKIIKGVREIGACTTGAIDGTAEEQAAVLLWLADDNGDYKIQLSEMALLECTIGGAPADCLMRYRRLAYPANWTTGQISAENGDPISTAELYDEAAIASFRDILDASPYKQTTVVARNIVGAEFRRSDSAAAKRPTFFYLLNVHRGTYTETEYGSVAVRTPTTYPS